MEYKPKGKKTKVPVINTAELIIRKSDIPPINNEILIDNNIPIKEKEFSKTILILKIVSIGFTLSVLYHSFMAYKGFIYPYNTFLGMQKFRFSDFYDVYKPSVGLHPYDFMVNYFPLTFLLMYFFTLLPMDLSLLLFITSFIIFFVIYLYNNMPFIKLRDKLIGVFILLLSYPFLLVLDRANIEIWVFMALVMFFYFYLKGKDILSIFFLSMAICFKLFPALLCLLFIFDRKYLLVIYTGISTLFLSLVSAAIFEGGITQSINGLMVGLSGFHKNFDNCSRAYNLQHNASIMVPLKFMFYNYIVTSGRIIPRYEAVFSYDYLIFAFTFFLLLLFFIFRYKFTFWKRVTLLILAFILLPQISYDYRLISIYIPVILFINTKEYSKLNIVYSIIFGLLLIPKDYIMIVEDVSISSIINPLLILSMMVLIIIEAIISGDKMKFTFSRK